MLRPLTKELVAAGGAAHKRWVKTVRAGLGVLLLGALGVTASPAIAQTDTPLGGVSIVVEQEVGRQFVARGVTGPDGRLRLYLPAGRYLMTLTHATKALALAAIKRAAPADRTASISVQVSAYGTSRERRVEVAALSDGMEVTTFQTQVSSPVSVTILRREE